MKPIGFVYSALLPVALFTLAFVGSRKTFQCEGLSQKFCYKTKLEHEIKSPKFCFYAQIIKGFI